MNSAGTSSTTLSAGRLEVLLNGEWGTVCLNGFDAYEADIACKEMGYRYAIRFGTVAALG